MRVADQIARSISRRCSQYSCHYTAPNDHFIASPNGRVTVSAVGALMMLVADPTICAGLYLPPVSRLD